MRCVFVCPSRQACLSSQVHLNIENPLDSLAPPQPSATTMTCTVRFTRRKHAKSAITRNNEGVAEKQCPMTWNTRMEELRPEFRWAYSASTAQAKSSATKRTNAYLAQLVVGVVV